MPSKQGKLDPTASSRAATHLRDRILNGDIPPGARIGQEAVAQELGVSRIPVREAMRQLETEGLLILTPHGSARVPRLDIDEYTEVYKMREYLEPLAAAESAVNIAGAELDELRGLLEATERAHTDLGAYVDADREFHLASYLPSRMPRLLRLVEGFWNTTQAYRRAFMSTLTPEEVEVVRAEHRLIYNALARHDSLEVENLVRLHIRRTRLRLDTHREMLR